MKVIKLKIEKEIKYTFGMNECIYYSHERFSYIFNFGLIKKEALFIVCYT